MAEGVGDCTGAQAAPSSTRTAALEASLANMATDFVHATNARAWDLSRHPWTHLSPDFRAERIFAHWPAELDAAGFFQHFQQLVADHPHYYTKATDITANANIATGHASVFVNMQNYHFTPGVTRYSVGILSFQGLGDGEWKCVRYASIPGSSAVSGKGADVVAA